MRDADFAALYLERLGLDALPEPGGEGLAHLVRTHVERIPFENLDVVAGRPISLHPDALAVKILAGRRGGGCYELHGLLLRLLRTAGFEADLLAARYIRGDGSRSPEDDHATLLVHGPVPVLVDVSFGAMAAAPVGPAGSPDAAACYRISADGGDLIVTTRGRAGPTPRFAVSPAPRLLDSFEPALRRHEKPGGPFSTAPLARIAAREGGFELRGAEFTADLDGLRRTRRLGPAERSAALARFFGIDPVPPLP